MQILAKEFNRSVFARDSGEHVDFPTFRSESGLFLFGGAKWLGIVKE